MSRQEIRGPLRRNPRNPRYFTDDSGRAISLTGTHTWNNLLDMGQSDPPPLFDFDWYLDLLEGLGHNFVRLWTWGLLRTHWNAQDVVSPFPWARTGPGLARDGRPKFDLLRYDEGYFERLRTRVAAAQARGIYVSVMLFESCAIGEPRADVQVFSQENSVNGPRLTAFDPNGIPLDWVTLTNPEVTHLQEAYVRRVVETVNGFANVLYEICNEAGPHSHQWQDHFVAFLRQCEAALPEQHPIGVTAGMGVDNAWLFASEADWASPEGWAPEGETHVYRDGSATWGATPPERGDRVVLLDTDHIWGCGGDVPWIWKSVCRGYQVLYMDPADDLPFGFYRIASRPPKADPAVRREMGRARAYLERMDLNEATPQNALASTGYCLAQPGAAYLIYQPAAGGFTVHLEAGMYEQEWHDPRAGQAIIADPLAVGSGPHDFEAPFAGASVLYLHQAAPGGAG